MIGNVKICNITAVKKMKPLRYIEITLKPIVPVM